MVGEPFWSASSSMRRRASWRGRCWSRLFRLTGSTTCSKRTVDVQYVRELLFSTVVELMTLVVLGLRPSLHAAARRSDLPVSLTALHDKINHTEPEVLRALV